MGHAALWLVLKTDGELHDRANELAHRMLPLVALFTLIGVPVTAFVRRAALQNYLGHPVLFVIPTAVAVSLWLPWRWNRSGRELQAFLASCAYIAFALAGVVAALYPALLPSTYGSQFDITIFNAATGSYALRVGFIWWGVAMLLAIGYFIFMYRMFRGKVRNDSTGYTHG